MKIEANDKEIQDIFKLGYFRIPRFQRPYSWRHDEVNNFWNDIIQESNDTYFIGSMVVYQTKKPNFGIVDGQQRLTTITLILAAIRNAFIKIDEENLAKGIHYFIERPNVDNEDEFILNSETSFPYFQNHIQSFNGLQIQCSVGSEEQNLKYAFDFINSSLNDLLPGVDSEGAYQLSLFEEERLAVIEKLREIRDKILSLKLVFIQLDNEEDAYLIFETLNARGRDLTTSDLVKNHFLKKLKSNNSSNDSAKLIWNGILKRFDDAGFQNGMDSFLYHFWLSKKNYTTDKKLFSELKADADDSHNAKSLLRDLQTNSIYYLSMIAPNSYKWSPEEEEVKHSLDALILFNVKQQSSMVLALIRAYRERRITLRILRKALKEIEYFHFVFNAVTSQRSSGSIAAMYSRHAIALSEATDHDAIQAVLHQWRQDLFAKLPSFNEFQANFNELSYTSRRTKDKAVIKYILKEALGANPAGLSVDYQAMSIEHLIAEDRMNSVSTEDEVGNIGNLILVDKKTNAEDLSNLDFARKKRVLLMKGYPLDDVLLATSEWDSDMIHKRAALLAHNLYYQVRQ